MSDYHAELDRRTGQFAEYLRLMGMRRHKFVKDDDCFIIFDESVPGVDAPRVEESAAVKVECLAGGGPASEENGAANPPSTDWSPGKPFRYVQFCFCQDCFYLELPNRTLFQHEAELILKQRPGFFWAKDRQDILWVQANWKDIAKWNPLQKIYLYRDEESAAEDMAFIVFQVWKFPVDWPWYVTAATFHAGHSFEQGRPLPP